MRSLFSETVSLLAFLSSIEAIAIPDNNGFSIQECTKDLDPYQTLPPYELINNNSAVAKACFNDYGPNALVIDPVKSDVEQYHLKWPKLDAPHNPVTIATYDGSCRAWATACVYDWRLQSFNTQEWRLPKGSAWAVSWNLNYNVTDVTMWHRTSDSGDYNRKTFTADAQSGLYILYVASDSDDADVHFELALAERGSLNGRVKLLALPLYPLYSTRCAEGSDHRNYPCELVMMENL